MLEIFNPLQILFFETFLGYKTIVFYTTWNETDVTYLLPVVSTKSFHLYWKLLFNTLNRIKAKQTENT